MKQHLTREDVTQEVIDSAHAYIAALAWVQTVAEIVKPIQAKVFTGFVFYNDLHVELAGAERERITDPDRLYLSQDEPNITAYYTAIDKALRENGIKPADMPEEHCPFLVAEDKQVKAEWALIEAAARMLGVDKPETFNHRLLCQARGLEKRREFIELTAKLVVNL